MKRALAMQLAALEAMDATELRSEGERVYKTSSAKPASKIGMVADLLQREDGATLADMIAVTGWRPHTTRAALTGLRKKGHTIVRDTRDGSTLYSMAAS
jgi:hypothetical protein